MISLEIFGNRIRVVRYLGLLLLIAAAWLFAMPVLAATEPASEVDWFQLIMGLFGGLALFLFGMDQMSAGLKAAAGDSLKDVLAKLTTQQVMSMKGEVRHLSDKLLERKAERLSGQGEDSLVHLRNDMAAIDQVRRVYTLAKRIAKTVLASEVAAKN